MQLSAKPRLAVTLVDNDDHDVGACVVDMHVDSCEAVVTTGRGKGVRVGSGTRAVVARACDAMLGFHRPRCKHDTVVLF
jgi:hypothetical protein